MDNLFGLIVLSITQGITELLPISSSGHLILISDLLEIDPEVILLTFLHLASAVALTLAYWKELFSILKLGWSKLLLVARNLIIAGLPIIIIGVLFGDQIDDIFYNPTFIGANLIFWGVVMIITEQFIEKKQIAKYEESSVNNSSLKINEISVKQALIIGGMQVLSLLPGTSRSGVTTSVGIWTGMQKSQALDFSFIMGIPLLFGAFFYEFILKGESLSGYGNTSIVVAFLITAFVSYLAIILLRKFIKKSFLTLFGIYRIVLGASVLLLLS